MLPIYRIMILNIQNLKIFLTLFDVGLHSSTEIKLTSRRLFPDLSIWKHLFVHKYILPQL